MSAEPITPEDGITSPEQEIKDVFKTSTDNKLWLPGAPIAITDWENHVQLSRQQASVGKTLALSEVSKQIEQLKAFQTHGS